MLLVVGDVDDDDDDDGDGDDDDDNDDANQGRSLPRAVSLVRC